MTNIFPVSYFLTFGEHKLWILFTMKLTITSCFFFLMMMILVSTEVNSSNIFDKMLDQLIKINKNIATIHNDLKAIQFFHERSKENTDNQGLLKGAILCFRKLYFYFWHGEGTPTASQLSSPASQKSKDLNKVLLLLQDLADNPRNGILESEFRLFNDMIFA